MKYVPWFSVCMLLLNSTGKLEVLLLLGFCFFVFFDFFFDLFFPPSSHTALCSGFPGTEAYLLELEVELLCHLFTFQKTVIKSP